MREIGRPCSSRPPAEVRGVPGRHRSAGPDPDTVAFHRPGPARHALSGPARCSPGPVAGAGIPGPGGRTTGPDGGPTAFAGRLSPLPPRRRHRLSGAFLVLVVLGLVTSVLVGAHGGWADRESPALARTDPVFAVERVAEPAAAPSALRPGPAALGKPDLDALSRKVSPGLVNINTQITFQHAQSAGSGIVLSATGDVLTNNHVINGASSIKVTDVGNGRIYNATVVGYDRAHDVAVLRMAGATGLSTSAIGNSSGVKVGDPVAAIGNAGGAGGQPKISGGAVTALDRSISPNDELTGSVEQLSGLIEVNANVQPGDSGGALVDGEGRVIGVNTAASASRKARSGGGRGYAIPINSAMAIARQIQSGQGSSTVHTGPSGMLGVSVVTSSARQSDDGVVSDGRRMQDGLTVAGVQANSPAAQAGLKRGDLLLAMDGRALSSADALTTQMIQHHPGDKVSLQWLDSADQRRTATIALIPGPPS